MQKQKKLWEMGSYIKWKGCMEVASQVALSSCSTVKKQKPSMCLMPKDIGRSNNRVPGKEAAWPYFKKECYLTST